MINWLHNVILIEFIWLKKPQAVSLLSLLTSRNARKAQADQSIPNVCLLCLKKKSTRKPLKVVAAKTPLSIMYTIGTTCFDECFLFSKTTRKPIRRRILHYEFRREEGGGGIIQPNINKFRLRGICQDF